MLKRCWDHFKFLEMHEFRRLRLGPRGGMCMFSAPQAKRCPQEDRRAWLSRYTERLTRWSMSLSLSCTEAGPVDR